MNPDDTPDWIDITSMSDPFPKRVMVSPRGSGKTEAMAAAMALAMEGLRRPWKFGDILRFKGGTPKDRLARFMFIAKGDDPAAEDPVWVMSLCDPWPVGHVTIRNARIFKRAED